MQQGVKWIPCALRLAGMTTKGEGADRLVTLQQHQCGILDERAELLKELCSNRAVDNAMIAAEGDAEPMPDDNLIVGIDHRLLDNTPDRKDSRLRRVDDRLKSVNARSAQV